MMANTLFLRFIAILLITNSHLDSLYPIKWLGVGGTLGNSLFFFLSGLGLALSFAKSSGTSAVRFIDWLKRRCSKIYYSLWLIALFSTIIHQKWLSASWIDLLSYFLYPTAYWFIAALIVFYVLIFPVLRSKNRTLPLKISGLLLIPYFLLYFTVVDRSSFTIEGNGLFKWIFYFQVMLLGVWTAYIHEQKIKSTSVSIGKDSLFWLVSLALHLVLRLMASQGHFLQFQFLIQWTTLTFAYFSVQLLQKPLIDQWLNRSPFINVCNFIGLFTLEIYLLQHEVYTSPWMSRIPFPLNVLAFWLTLVPLAFGFHWLAERLRQRLEREHRT